MPSRSKQEAQERAKTLSVTVPLPTRKSLDAAQKELSSPKQEPREETPTAKTIPGAALQLRDRKRRVDNAIEEGSK